ncbi:hypothetical protein SAMN05216382_2894 [Sphingomonas palmae]|uniref:Uncharacterized protein n=1 Tax=Sphingomonas palmae TaxID=1855283 RepID=A0A1H7U2S8_9SPHN|nr:hypothetical protein [Sphingomonas palmae]SEL90557.1 hypothetical protein SAMN05216382_2894 [Sphingomonas palmae]
MGKAITEASWIGKAAYEIMQTKGWNGREANASARDLAAGLLDYGVDLARIDPRDYARRHFGFSAPSAARIAPVATRLFVSHDEDGLELHVDAGGLFADRLIGWDFANAIIDAFHGRSWSDARGYSVDTASDGIVVTMPATAVRHGVAFTLSRAQVVDFGNACLTVVRDGSHLELASVPGRWGAGPTSPVVRARLAERSRLAA